MATIDKAVADAENAYNLSLAKRLAHSSDAGIRDRTVRMLATWVAEHTSATELEYMKLWKALFYCVWYSDKVPVQQELVFTLARLVREVEADLPRALLFLRTFYTTIQREWMGLDRLRLDKFFSLIRRGVYETLRLVGVHEYSSDALEGVAALFAQDVLSKEPNGVRYQVTDVFLEELCAALPDITAPQLWTLLRGFTLACQTVEPSVFVADREYTPRVLQEVLQGLVTRATAAHTATDAPAPEPVKFSFPGLEADDHRLVMLSQDATERQRAQAAAFKKVNLAALARHIWTLASSRELQSGLRKRMYALHATASEAAIAVGHAKNAAATMPKGAGVKADAASDTAATATAGTKRRRAADGAAETPVAPAVDRGQKKVKASKADAAAATDVDMDAALNVLPTVAELQAKGSSKPKAAHKRRVSGSAASAAVDVIGAEFPSSAAIVEKHIAPSASRKLPGVSKASKSKK